MNKTEFHDYMELRIALIKIARLVELEDDESWDNPYSTLESIDNIVTDVIDKGLLD